MPPHRVRVTAVAEVDDDGQWMRLESALLVPRGGRGSMLMPGQTYSVLWREVRDKLNPAELAELMQKARDEYDREVTRMMLETVERG